LFLGPVQVRLWSAERPGLWARCLSGGKREERVVRRAGARAACYQPFNAGPIPEEDRRGVPWQALPGPWSTTVPPDQTLFLSGPVPNTGPITE